MPDAGCGKSAIKSGSEFDQDALIQITKAQEGTGDRRGSPGGGKALLGLVKAHELHRRTEAVGKLRPWRLVIVRHNRPERERQSDIDNTLVLRIEVMR